jgi:hypothetical protein
MAHTYGTLELKNGRWIMTGVAPHVSIRLKSIFPKLAKSHTGTFVFPLTDEAGADLDWFLDRYPMRLSQADQEALKGKRKSFERKRDEIEEIMLPEWQPPLRYGFKPGKELYLGQAQAVEILHRLGRLLVLDDVGLGKTIVALGAIAGSANLPAAIIAPTHLPTQWVEEYVKPFTYMSSHIIAGTKPYSLPPANLYFFKYSNIAGWVDVAGTGMFKTVVFDEMQELRHGTGTAKGEAAKVFAEMAQVRLGLSASPVYGYASEMFNIMDYIAPGALGTWNEFVREWCSTMTGSGKWIVDDPDALGTYLRELQLVVRRLRQGRKINTLTIEVEHDEQVEKDSLDLARKLAMKVITGTFTERGQASRELDMYARMVTGISKAKAVAAYARILLKAGRPIILGGWHRECYSIWLRELAEFNPVMYTGSEDARHKDRAKKAFISGESNCMLMSVRSGLGVDGLQKCCSTFIFGEFDWSPAVGEQCLGRLDRPGQPEDVVDAIYLWTNSGSDPLIMEMLGLKASQARGIVDPMRGVEAVYSDKSRIQALAEKYLKEAI